MEAKDYGAAAVHLETVRRMVEQRCPRAIFAGFSRDGARCAQYRFVLPYGRSVLVQGACNAKWQATARWGPSRCLGRERDRRR